jgi:hypothetical protein
MRNRFIAGLFATAVLILAPPVAAEEYIPQIRSINADVEEIQDMRQRSCERQGVVCTTQEVKSEPIAPPVSSQNVETEPVIEPISEPITRSTTVATVREQLAPVTVNQSAVSANTPESVQPTTQTLAPYKSTFYNHSTHPVTVSANLVLSEEPQTLPQSKVVPQSSQQIAVRHAGIQRHQHEVADPEPTREQQLTHRGFLLFASDLAWNRVDETSDKSIRNPYSLGARLERGVITPLAALRVYAPHRVAEAIAILRGEKEYT